MDSIQGRTLEIVDKDVTAVKLTITKLRVCIKFPLTYTGDKEEMKGKLLQIVNFVGFPEFSLRGRVSEQNTISLEIKNKEILFMFDLSGKDVEVIKYTGEKRNV